MKAKISKVILWPKRSGKKPRVIEFKLTGVNVVTGGSQTGKSSLIPIIDYCLGSEKCAIPVGEIRNAAEWFGVVLRFPKTEMIVARRNPGLLAETGEMYLDEAANVQIPESIERNAYRDAVVNRLNQLAGLSSLSFTGADNAGFGERPSFRDTAAFQFQPQHIVANPYTLFFKADTFEHQEKLKHVFPLVLGVIDNQMLELRRELRSLESELEQKKGQLEQRRRANGTWLPEIRAFYLQARAYGLLPDAPDPQLDWAIEVFLGYLRSVPKALAQAGLPRVERGASQRLAREIAALEKEEETIDRAIGDRQRKLTKIERMKGAADGYGEALAIQAERLEPLHWFSSRIQESHACPVCGAETASGRKEVEHLAALAREMEGAVGTVQAVNLVLDKEAATLREQLLELENALDGVRQQLDKLRERSDELRTQKQTSKNIYEFGGQLKQQLQNIDAVASGSDLAERVKELERKVRELRGKLDQQSVRRREEAALTSISEATGHYARILSVEHAERRARLDIRNLTLTVEGPNGRLDYLWEIGSAANWMGYHVAALLALHEHFLTVAHSPVPQFLVIDQPSQAFFPEGMPLDGPAPESKQGARWSSDDVSRVNMIFRALAEATKRMGDKVQIIVIEHADEITWEGAENIQLIARWRGSEALIPADWLV